MIRSVAIVCGAIAVISMLGYNAWSMTLVLAELRTFTAEQVFLQPEASRLSVTASTVTASSGSGSLGVSADQPAESDRQQAITEVECKNLSPALLKLDSLSERLVSLQLALMNVEGLIAQQRLEPGNGLTVDPVVASAASKLTYRARLAQLALPPQTENAVQRILDQHDAELRYRLDNDIAADRRLDPEEISRVYERARDDLVRNLSDVLTEEEVNQLVVPLPELPDVGRLAPSGFFQPPLGSMAN